MTNILINQNSRINNVPIRGVAEAGDIFGASVVAGNFDGRQGADLAAGVPGEDIGAISNAGAVNVLRGSSSGLTANGDQVWHQNSPGILGASEAGDKFGASLASGDFNGDGRDDLAAGVPGENSNAGAVNVLRGSFNGLTANGDQAWHQNSPGILGASEAGDKFGASLASGDFNGDGRDDLAVGVPGEDIGDLSNAGVVNVLHGSNNGLTANGNQVWHQNSPGILGASEAGDKFGASLASGDFNGDGRDDLAVGVPDENIGGIINAGAVNILYGSNIGLTANGDQIWHQNSPGILGVSEAGDRFGASLDVGDFNLDGFDDLAIGVFGEDIDLIGNAGSAQIIFGSITGLAA